MMPADKDTAFDIHEMMDRHFEQIRQTLTHRSAEITRLLDEGSKSIRQYTFGKKVSDIVNAKLPKRR